MLRPFLSAFLLIAGVQSASCSVRNCQIVGAYSNLLIVLPESGPQAYLAHLDVVTLDGEVASVDLECPTQTETIETMGVFSSPLTGNAYIKCISDSGQRYILWETSGESDHARQGPLPKQFVLDISSSAKATRRSSAPRQFVVDDIAYETLYPNYEGCPPVIQQARVELD